MSRLQLALNVSNLDDAVAFYSAFFKTEPSKIRPGYTNFAIAEPPLKLVLFENAEAPGTINHLGVEVFSTEEVVAAASYLADRGFATDVEVQTTCFMPSRTRSGSTVLTRHAGRSTRCSPMYPRVGRPWVTSCVASPNS